MAHHLVVECARATHGIPTASLPPCVSHLTADRHLSWVRADVDTDGLARDCEHGRADDRLRAPAPGVAPGKGGTPPREGRAAMMGRTPRRPSPPLGGAFT